MSRSEKGLALLEIIVMLIVLTILAGVVVSALLQNTIRTRVESTIEELKQIQRAVAGDVRAGNYGYAGDMGRLPRSLDELVRIGNQRPYSTANTNGVGMGWNGPYLNIGSSAQDALTDAFGNSYDYGVAGEGQIRSAGADGTFGTPDDLVYPPQPFSPYGRVIVTLRVYTGNQTLIDPPGYTVKLFYSSDGAEQSVSDSAPPFVFEDIHQGLHAIQVMRNNQVLSSTATEVQAGGTRLVEMTATVSQPGPPGPKGGKP